MLPFISYRMIDRKQQNNSYFIHKQTHTNTQLKSTQIHRVLN